MSSHVEESAGFQAVFALLMLASTVIVAMAIYLEFGPSRWKGFVAAGNNVITGATTKLVTGRATDQLVTLIATYKQRRRRLRARIDFRRIYRSVSSRLNKQVIEFCLITVNAKTECGPYTAITLERYTVVRIIGYLGQVEL